jgi:cytochrome b6-f complex subunit 4
LFDAASKQVRLCAGAGHNSYGESAWPGDVFYVFAPVIFAQLTLVAGFAVAGGPPLAPAAANPFLTPIEILPAWYLFPAFNVLRVRASKAAGVASVLALAAALAGAPLDAVALLAFAQNPFRRAAPCGSCLYALELALLTSLGAAEEIEGATPWL